MMRRPAFDDVQWRTAAYCSGGNCVEVAYQDGWFGVRDGKEGASGPVLVFSEEEWRAFLAGAVAGDFTPEALRS